MPSTDQVDNIYWAPVDPDAPNNSHAYSLQLIGTNRRVLELGPAAGHFTKVLVENGCRVVGVEVDPEAAERVRTWADRVVVGDLSDPAVIAEAIDDERFDVVVGGDVLEHLPDPLRVLRACRAALKPGGYVVLSLPNIAHADVKLQLLAGRFPYQDTGLLDRTHLHFFTLESIEEMVRDAGLLLIDVRRVTLPVFSTEQAVDRGTVSPEVLASVLADPESETYQFVVRATIHDGDLEVAGLAERVVRLQTELDREQARRVRAETELDAARAEVSDLRALHEEAMGHARGFEALAREHEQHIEALRSTRSYRMLAPFRALLGRRR
jgi:2-polyprenyl-3-methyl-5-hydroxy-6-metoxy-1,4-benzoquinol methylase